VQSLLSGAACNAHTPRSTSTLLLLLLLSPLLAQAAAAPVPYLHERACTHHKALLLLCLTRADSLLR
jgi:hypothetical protein